MRKARKQTRRRKRQITVSSGTEDRKGGERDARNISRCMKHVEGARNGNSIEEGCLTEGMKEARKEIAKGKRLTKRCEWKNE